MNKRSVVLGWHILEPSGRLSYNDGREPLDRRWVTMKQKRKPELCTRGMHACRHVVDTLKYSSGGYLCRVKVRGNIQEGTDKLCGNERPIVKRMSVDDTDKLFREFALELCEESIVFRRGTAGDD